MEEKKYSGFEFLEQFEKLEDLAVEDYRKKLSAATSPMIKSAQLYAFREGFRTALALGMKKEEGIEK